MRSIRSSSCESVPTRSRGCPRASAVDRLLKDELISNYKQWQWDAARNVFKYKHTMGGDKRLVRSLASSSQSTLRTEMNAARVYGEARANMRLVQRRHTGLQVVANDAPSNNVDNKEIRESMLIYPSTPPTLHLTCHRILDAVSLTNTSDSQACVSALGLDEWATQFHSNSHFSLPTACAVKKLSHHETMAARVHSGVVKQHAEALDTDQRPQRPQSASHRLNRLPHPLYSIRRVHR